MERRNIVFQMREYVPNRQKQRSYSMTLVTPDKATFIDCTEVSQTFEDKEIEGMKVYRYPEPFIFITVY